MLPNHKRSITEGDNFNFNYGPSQGYIGGQIAAIFSPKRADEVNLQTHHLVSTPQAKNRKDIVFQPYFKERDEHGKLIRDNSKSSISPVKVDTQEDQALFNLTQKKNQSRMSNFRSTEMYTGQNTDRSKGQMTNFLDTEMPEMQTSREHIRIETAPNTASKSYDMRRSESGHPKLMSYLSSGSLGTSSIRNDAFLIKEMPRKDSLFAKKAMRESVELAKIKQERKNVTRYSNAFQSVGRDRNKAHYVGIYDENKPESGQYTLNYEAIKPKKPIAFIPNIKFSSSKTPQPLYRENEKYEQYFPKLYEDKREFVKKERNIATSKGLPKHTQRAVKELRSLWQMEFDFNFYRDLRRRYGEKLTVPKQVKLTPGMHPFDERKLKNKQKDIL